MMQYSLSKDLRNFFLLKFTKELIFFSYRDENIKDLNALLEYQENLKKQKIDQEVVSKLKKDQKIIEEQKNLEYEKSKKILPKNEIPKKREKLIIPRIKPTPIRQRFVFPKIPERLRGIAPVKKRVDIDFKKLNPIVKNPQVNSIECDGPGQNIIIKGSRGIKKSDLVLTKDEIKELIETFSKKSKIPLNNGMNRIALGSFILSGVYNEDNPAFILSKIRTHDRMTGHFPHYKMRKTGFPNLPPKLPLKK